ncbi:protein kinase [Nonomuraea sp. NPDC000554]|uniref:serine/threonine-protein kinase n=1 Tax=Nonomuraea sp. NPDC000554 TaxID=3154259 RepID=UPI0033272CA0
MSVARCAGWLLAGRYRLRSELGRGGMGAVWRAHDELLDRDVAVKEVIISSRSEADRETLLCRTMREARIAARLSHPRIAAVYDVVLADERPWIVMQLVPARSLAEVIGERGPLPVLATARVGLDVLSALRAAHAAGVVHRDVKPANILLTGDGHAILTDFGLATTLGDEADLTQAGMVVGTPAYIAPERARGGPATPQADLWSLGATLYAAVEGRSPFGHSSELATLTAVLTSGPAPFERAGPLAPVITGLLCKDPARRTGADRVHDQLLRLAARSDKGARAAPSTVPSASGATADARPPETTRRHEGPPQTAPRLVGRPRMTRRKIAAHWRQVAAVAALVVSVVATTRWSAAPDGPADVAPTAAPHPAGILDAHQVSDRRHPIKAPRRELAVGRPEARRERVGGRPEPAAVTSHRARVPPGQAKKAKPKRATYKAVGHGRGGKH